MIDTIVPFLMFFTLFAVLWILAFGIRANKRDKERGTVSALSHHGDDVNAVAEARKGDAARKTRTAKAKHPAEAQRVG